MKKLILSSLIAMLLSGCNNDNNTSEPSAQTPGTSTPGTSTPGTSTPGTSTPGTSTPGTSTPDTSTPGTSTPDTSTPGTSTPGTSTPGTSTPGTSDPGTSTPGTSNPGTGIPDSNYATASGMAVLDEDSKNVSVTAKCKDGSGFRNVVVTDASGKWSGEVDKTKFPCAFEVKNQQLALHSYVRNVSEAYNVNITLFTDLSIALTTGLNTADWFKNSTTIDLVQLQKAQDTLTAKLRTKGYVVYEDYNFFTKPLIQGDAIYWSLINFKYNIDQAIKDKSLKDYSALLDSVKSGNLDAIPVFNRKDITEGDFSVKLTQTLSKPDKPYNPAVDDPYCVLNYPLNQIIHIKLNPANSSASIKTYDGQKQIEVTTDINYSPSTGLIQTLGLNIPTSETTGTDKTYYYTEYKFKYKFSYIYRPNAPDRLIGTISDTRTVTKGMYGVTDPNSKKYAGCVVHYDVEGQLIE